MDRFLLSHASVPARRPGASGCPWSICPGARVAQGRIFPLAERTQGPSEAERRTGGGHEADSGQSMGVGGTMWRRLQVWRGGDMGGPGVGWRTDESSLNHLCTSVMALYSRQLRLDARINIGHRIIDAALCPCGKSLYATGAARGRNLSQLTSIAVIARR